ncbi:rhodanese-like domain-containing protein [Deinococcus soli (ex Cha et al. 2016)]|uniref:Rhodanese-related sulfurtransferase n=2 Tax=Deinococcus soli (ex Cha et al. 2016) TaxID=1309411 RepID=A0AAE3XBM4_9DEIO|nr:rhodanese-like domain-containing protein [Deinococcus soli (ex Cha et al. 2016)]MDR6217994.1 rhodanese-related sulfurtransferase [Deinococcus soli (ex Cha et al. 2016)]MDR6328244.1 rhodanese-related sulfurtransferase [Deinococcus soli (ex Cha et al. 2016)]MDR6751096.1 rhodanese-related sulfurtransferase [Deinococcus soli (ex Cha et al. 2016)]
MRPTLLIGLLTMSACAPRAATYTTIPVQDLRAAQERGEYVLDVRTDAEYREGHVPGAALLPLADLGTRMNAVPRDRPVYVICRSGNRSAQASAQLVKAGYTQVFNVDGGMNAWTRAGYPAER